MRSAVSHGFEEETNESQPLWVTVAGLMFGIVAGSFEILNTSIGWHLASGRWMLDQRTILDHNPFTLGADGAAWLNHEWLFQIVVALIERLGTGPGLIGLRILVAIGLTLLLMHFGRRAGLSPASALVLACLCVAGARMRFYVRPELATLVLVPLGINLFLTRNQRRTIATAAALALISAVGVNLHGGILVLPAILAALVAAEGLTAIAERRSLLTAVLPGTAVVAAAIAGALFNPWGWTVLAAPFRLAHLVGQPWVPNPEWISPGPADVPALYVAMIATGILFVFRERSLARWMLMIVISALALRYVRNVGLFFTVLPLAVAPALSRLKILQRSGRQLSLAAAAFILMVAALMIDAPGFPLGWGYSSDRYPAGGSVFLEHTGLLNRPIYNDVRFGGWLIGRYFPPVQAFIDDRNEIHEDLLHEMWEIEQASSPHRWQTLLDRYQIETALLRYRQPVAVTTPDGVDLGFRGHSALWFPEKRWALLYWDDISMVLVDRTRGPSDLIDAFEYRHFRPDDGAHLLARADAEPSIRASLTAAVDRKLLEDPECRQARWLLAQLSAGN